MNISEQRELEYPCRQAFAEYAALALTQALRVHGAMSGRLRAERIECLCHAAR